MLLRRAPGEVADTYLGLLYPTEEYRVYGYISNTHVKFILVLAEVQTKDEALNKVGASPVSSHRPGLCCRSGFDPNNLLSLHSSRAEALLRQLQLQQPRMCSSRPSGSLMQCAMLYTHASMP